MFLVMYCLSRKGYLAFVFIRLPGVTPLLHIIVDSPAVARYVAVYPTRKQAALTKKQLARLLCERKNATHAYTMCMFQSIGHIICRIY